MNKRDICWRAFSTYHTTFHQKSRRCQHVQ